MTATCVYRLLEPATLRVELSAVSDRPTIVNLTQHSYFNLDGSPDILDHELTLFADFYTPADAELIPTGEIRAVAGTPYDFRTPRPVRDPALHAIRHQFRRSASARRRRSGANRGAAFAEERPDDEPVLDASPASSSTTRRRSTVRSLDWGRALRRACGPRARAAGFPGFAQPAPFHRLRAAAGRRVPARERISLRVTTASRGPVGAVAVVAIALRRSSTPGQGSRRDRPRPAPCRLRARGRPSRSARAP